MGLEQVKQEILENAQAQAEKILNEASKEIIEIKQSAEEKVQKETEEFNAATESAVDNMKKKEIAAVNFDAKRELAAKRKELIDQVMNGAKAKLEKLSDSTRKTYVTKLIKKAQAQLDIERILCTKKDKKHIPSKVKTKESSMLGGIVAENADGTISVDLSYKTILDTIKEKELHEIAKLLF